MAIKIWPVTRTSNPVIVIIGYPNEKHRTRALESGGRLPEQAVVVPMLKDDLLVGVIVIYRQGYRI